MESTNLANVGKYPEHSRMLTWILCVLSFLFSWALPGQQWHFRHQLMEEEWEGGGGGGGGER